VSQVKEIGSSASVEFDRLREVVEKLDQILVLLSADMGRVFYVSPAYERITGYSCQSLYENSGAWVRLLYEKDRSEVAASVAKLLLCGPQARSDLEYRIRTADDRIRWLRTTIRPATGGTEGTPRLVAVAEDITERKQAELALKQEQAELAGQIALRTQELSQTVTRLEQEIQRRKQIELDLQRTEAWFRQVFKTKIIGVVCSDIYGNVSDANDAFLEMTGYSRADLPLRWDTMTAPEWSHTSELAVQQLVSEGSLLPFQKEYLRKDGTRVSVLVGSALLDRETWQCVTFTLDLTGHKKAEEQIREVNLQLDHASRLSLMGELLADLAHEIHQPLGVITNYANGSLRRLKQGQLKVGKLKELLQEIAAESLRVGEILRRIRDFVRRREPERKVIDLNATVMAALQFTRLERREERVAVIFRPDRDIPDVQADQVQITQVLVNLLLNAVQALSASGSESPKILVSSFLNEAGLAEVTIADNGPGISPADVLRIFDRFFTTKPNGLGLGLAISRSIVESHGGRLWYDSAPGESALFRLTLPVKSALAEAAT